MRIQEIQRDTLEIIHSGRMIPAIARWLRNIEANAEAMKQSYINVTGETVSNGENVIKLIEKCDLSKTLRIIELYAKSDNAVSNNSRLIINMIRSIRDLRNRWSHQTASGIGAYELKADLQTLKAFLITMNCDELLEAVDSLLSNAVNNAQEVSRIQLLPNMPKLTELDGGQRKIVNRRYQSTVYVNGVSGSGKTSILIHKAIVLSDNDPEKPILIVTLNKPLAQFIDSLISELSRDSKPYVEVTSMFELCQKLLISMTTDKEDSKKRYTDVTYGQNKQHVDEIWREYYRREVNNNDAAVLFGLHQELISRNINAEQYIRQEFDLIRSEFPIKTEDYLTYYRAGRVVNFPRNQREAILLGLKKWEDKMAAVGVIDHIGLALALYHKKLQLNNIYSHILVDECQDFGTVELGILRHLVAAGDEDLLLFGDKAQGVTHKKQNPIKSGVSIQETIHLSTNKRNTKEILEAANAVFMTSLRDSPLRQKVLTPVASEISHLKPLVCHTDDNEVAYALSYVNHNKMLNPTSTACIVLAGYTWLEIKEYSELIQIPILDSDTNVTQGNTFISDLEQTKGFEFDIVVICNSNDNVLPNRHLPATEIEQQASRLYVAMTRAKFDLIISHKGILSRWISECSAYFDNSEWKDIVKLDGVDVKRKYPRKIAQLTDQPNRIVLDMTALQFLYSDYAIGLSVLDQNALQTAMSQTCEIRECTIADILSNTQIRCNFTNTLNARLSKIQNRFSN